jgi:undecaprenyl-diphosphatase
MKDKRNKKIIAWILLGISIFASLYFDNFLIKSISFLRNGILDYFFLFVTFASSEVIIFLFLSSLFLWKEHKRKWIVPLWISLGLSAITSFILKITVQRDRPFQLGLVTLIPKLQEASYSVWNFSFPSSHSMIAFCAIPILSQKYPKLKKVWIGIAILIALSRIYFGLHFVSDVIIGGAIGYLIGVIVVKLEKEYRFGEKIYGKITGK